MLTSRYPEVDGTTPLMVAAGVGCVPGQWIEPEKDVFAAVKYLVEDLKADVNEHNKENETPLHGAVCRSADSVIQYLADKGAKFVKDEEGQTPLDVAVDGLNRAVSINGPRIIIFRFPGPYRCAVKEVGSEAKYRSGGDRPLKSAIPAPEANYMKVAALLSFLLLVCGAYAGDTISIWNGVYSLPRRTGARVSTTNNAQPATETRCRGRTDPRWRHRSSGRTFDGLTAEDLVGYVQKSMPRGRAGTLTREQATDLVAFLFISNGFPSGGSELPGDAATLKKIRFDSEKPKQ